MFVEKFDIPETLRRSSSMMRDENEFIAWEDELLSFFSSQYQKFTRYPDYFKLRTYEFRILRQLLPTYFDLSKKYESALEIGCNFGYKSILLSAYAHQLLAIDIPEMYDGCVLGEFKKTTDVAKVLVNEHMKISNVVFENRWPQELKIKDGSVDFIFTEYVLEHIPKLSAAVQEMARVMKKDAVMIHTVPNTHDAIRAYIDANIQISFGQLFKIVKSQIGSFLKNEKRNKPTLRINGTIVPPCHSEHIDQFSEQLNIYTLENYLFPMLESGFMIENIISTREYNHVIVARKR